MALLLTTLKNYDREELKTFFRELLDSDFGQRLEGKKTVLLKPNFVVPEAPELGATTHPDFYMSLAIVLQERGKTVAIGESPAFGSCEKALCSHGVYEECLERGIEVVEFRKSVNYTGVEDESAYETLSIAKEIGRFDAMINLPKLKVHQQFVFTGATKNLYGCVVGKRKVFRHNTCKNDPTRFAKMVIANAEQAAAVLHISDGIHAMHVKGPRGGEVYPLTKVIVSDSYLEHDYIFAKMIGLTPEKTPLFKAVEPKTCEELARVCEKILTKDDFTVPKDFIHSYRTDISFSPFALMRSAYRSVKIRMKLLGV